MVTGILTTLLTLSMYILNPSTGQYLDVSANPYIIDMDFSSDVDDAVAVRIATMCDAYGVGKLEGICLGTVDPLGKDRNVLAMTTLLDYDGYATTPIGKPSVNDVEGSRYWDAIVAESTRNHIVMDSVELYKDKLANCANPVTIITTGYLDNIQALLQDEEGYELVKNNCKRIVITGGTYPKGSDHNFSGTEAAKESSKYVNQNAPCEIVYVANDVGGEFSVGSYLQKEYPEDPISKALFAWGAEDKSGRVAWDPIAVFIGIMPEKATNVKYEDSIVWIGDGQNSFEKSDTYTGRRVVRRIDEITLEQYCNMLNGVLASRVSIFKLLDVES